MMDGRVKTLHPVVHGGLLGRAGIDDAVMAKHGIAPIVPADTESVSLRTDHCQKRLHAGRCSGHH